MATIEVNGARLGYEDAGAGPVVVFSHAGIADRRMWEHQFQHLRADYRGIRYDARGYGDSDDPAGEVTPYRDLLGLLDALGVAQATLVGCSIGGSYALEAALAAPERVSALVLICAGTGDPGEVRQLHGRSGEVCAPESATDRLVVI